MFNLVAIALCLASPDATLAKIVLETGSLQQVTSAQAVWLDGSQTFETSYGKCELFEIKIEKN